MKIRDDFIPYSKPCFDQSEIDAVSDAVRSNWWSKGPKTAEFEKEFAKFVGAKHALALNSCTAALHLSLAANGIGEGDEVISTPMTFCSTVNMVVNCGAKPVFVDIDESTGLMNPDNIEKAITSATRAIMPVHYAGQSCDMDRINSIADKHGLLVIEDAAHAVYTTYKDRMIGNGKNPTAFSFYATKNLAVGEGGMLTSNDDDFMQKARVLSLHGMSANAWNRYSKTGSWRYDVLAPGFKYNMTDIAASIGLVQLARLENMQTRREEISAYYNKQFEKLPGISLMKETGMGRNAHHLYAILVDKNELTIGRDEFIEILKEYKIGTSVHFIPVHMHPFYKEHFGTKEGDFPAAERLFSKTISLPMHPAMNDEEVEYVANAVREIAEKHAR